MTFREVRHEIISGLHSYMKIPVNLSSQVGPEPDPPFVFYSCTSPYIPDDTLGDYETVRNEDGTTTKIRREQATCTMSFTVCSVNRMENGRGILGEDEALDLAEKAAGWFIHSGYAHTSGKGITIVDVSSVQERSFLQVDEEVRRYGFDVTIRYVREDEQKIGTIESVMVFEKGENE